MSRWTKVVTLRPGQSGWHVADDMFKCMFGNENYLIFIRISNTKVVLQVPIDNDLPLVNVWRQAVNWITVVPDTWPPHGIPGHNEFNSLRNDDEFLQYIKLFKLHQTRSSFETVIVSLPFIPISKNKLPKLRLSWCLIDQTNKRVYIFMEITRMSCRESANLVYECHSRTLSTHFTAMY